jgi:hypothetical protein
MISRVSSSLIDDIRRRSSKLSPFALEAQVRNTGHILIAIAKVVRKEEHQPLHLSKECSLYGNLLQITSLGEFESLNGV